MPLKYQNADSATTQEPARRTALKQMASALGLGLSASALDSLANPAQVITAADLKFFTKAQHLLVGVIAEHIIPATETPGALAVGAHTFLDQFLTECCTPDEQTQFKRGLDKIEKISDLQFKCSFLKATTAQQIQLLTQIDNYQAPFTKDDGEFFTLFKTLTLFAYYTSEVGASKELAYLAIPGGYKGNVPFAKVGKAWSLN